LGWLLPFLQFESVVASVFVGAVSQAWFELGVVGVAELVAAGQEVGGVAVFGGDRWVCGQVRACAVDCGVTVGGGVAEFLRPGQVVGQGVDEAVRGGPVPGGGVHQQQFGVGAAGVLGEVAQLVGVEVISVVDDE
jgi:hypothetical protein